MKVLLINGSPRQHGNTAIALAEIAKQLEQEGIESEMVWIGNKPIRGCIACGQCKAKGLEQCVYMHTDFHCCFICCLPYFSNTNP